MSNSPEDENNSDTSTAADPPDRNRADGNAPGENLPDPDAPITKDEWSRLRAPFSRRAYVVEKRAAGRVEAHLPVEEGTREENSQADRLNQAVVDLRLSPEAIRERLDLVIGPHRYSYRMEPAPDDGADRIVICHLHIGAASRSGTGVDSSYRTARRIALASAAVGFGIGRSGKTTGPIMVGREGRFDLPSSVLEALETRVAPSLWAPEESA